MSHVILLAADHPLPLYDPGVRREVTVQDGRDTVILHTDGFAVREHSYYRQAVDALELPMRRYRYELDLAATAEDAARLRRYLREHLAAGEQAELWAVWVPRDEQAELTYYQGRLDDLEWDDLKLLDGWDVCLTVERSPDPGLERREGHGRQSNGTDQ